MNSHHLQFKTSETHFLTLKRHTQQVWTRSRIINTPITYLSTSKALPSASSALTVNGGTIPIMTIVSLLGQFRVVGHNIKTHELEDS